jgi:hypothetical protein
MYLWLRPSSVKKPKIPRKPKSPEKNGGDSNNINELARSIDPKVLEAMREKGRKRPESVSVPIPKPTDSAIIITEEPDDNKTEEPTKENNNEVDDEDEEYEETESITYYKLDIDGNVAREYHGIEELQTDGYDFKEVARCCNGEIDKHKNAKFTTIRPN